MELIIDGIIYTFAIFGFVCAVFFTAMYFIIKADSKTPTSEQVYAAEKKRREYASKT